MSRNPTTRDRTLYQCVDAFAIWKDGVPVAYSPGQMVLADDPILRTHRANFTLAADRVEQATAAPGQVRAVSIPASPETQPQTESEPEDAQASDSAHP